MKKIIIVVLSILIVLIAIFMNWYFSIQKELSEITTFNNQFLKYTDKKFINGVEVTTVMNRAIDINEKNEISKDEKGAYILNDKNSIEVMVKFQEGGNFILMEAFDKEKMKSFTELYGNLGFKTVNVKKNSEGKISKISFELIN